MIIYYFVFCITLSTKFLLQTNIQRDRKTDGHFVKIIKICLGYFKTYKPTEIWKLKNFLNDFNNCNENNKIFLT